MEEGGVEEGGVEGGVEEGGVEVECSTSTGASVDSSTR